MANPLADDVRVLNDEQLAEAINEAYRELFNLQFQRGARQLQDANTLRTARRQIARLRTIQRERVLAAALGAPLAPSAPAPAPDISPQKQRAQAERTQREAEAAAEAEASEAAIAEAEAATDDAGTEVGDAETPAGESETEAAARVNSGNAEAAPAEKPEPAATAKETE